MTNFDYNREMRLSLTEDEILAMFNFVDKDQAKFARLFRFLGNLAQAPIYRPDDVGLEIYTPRTKEAPTETV